MSCFARPRGPCAYAVRARNDGAKPRLTSANAPSLRKARRENIISSAALLPLKCRRAKRDAVRCCARDGDAAELAGGEREAEVHAADQRARVDPRIGGVLVAGRRLAL